MLCNCRISRSPQRSGTGVGIKLPIPLIVESMLNPLPESQKLLTGQPRNRILDFVYRTHEIESNTNQVGGNFSFAERQEVARQRRCYPRLDRLSLNPRIHDSATRPIPIVVPSKRHLVVQFSARSPSIALSYRRD